MSAVLTLQQGFSAFELAKGCSPMIALLKPWLGSALTYRPEPDDHTRSIARFISRTARSLASMSEVDTKSHQYYNLDVRWRHLRMLCNALLRLATFAATDSCQRLPTPSRSHSYLASTPTGTRSRWTSVPVRRAEILTEWRLIHTDALIDLNCDLCFRQGCRKYYVCLVCQTYLCSRCYYPTTADPTSSQHINGVRELRQHEKDLKAALDGLRGISCQDSTILRKVLCQHVMLRRWVLSKERAYRTWQSEHSCHNHFRPKDFPGWNAVYIMTHSLSLAPNSPSADIGDLGNGSSDSTWHELTRQWQDIYAFNNIDMDSRLPCTHKNFVQVTTSNVHSIDGHSIHESSGLVSFAIFEALAEKYEDAVLGEAVDFQSMQSKSLFDWLNKGPWTDNCLLPPSTTLIPQFIDGRTTESDSGSGTSDSDSATTTSQNSEDSSIISHDSEALAEVIGEGTATEGIPADSIEDLLDTLLQRLKSLSEDDPQREETELVLETAWRMGQAIVYHDTPRPSLKEMAEQNSGYHIAPGSPVTSNHDHEETNGSPTMYTARSISPVSWFSEDDL